MISLKIRWWQKIVVSGRINVFWCIFVEQKIKISHSLKIFDKIVLTKVMPPLCLDRHSTLWLGKALKGETRV